MERLIFVIIIIISSGCATTSIVNIGSQTIKSITVTPTAKWNKVPPALSIGGVTTWTSDGISLNTISFFSDIKDGQTMMKTTKKQQYPVFKTDMLPTELIELIESTLAKAYDAKILSSGDLIPLKIGSDDGFEYSFDFVMLDELPRRGYIAGAVKNEKLHLIFYQAAKLHYYDSLINDVKVIVRTAVLK